MAAMLALHADLVEEARCNDALGALLQAEGPLATCYLLLATRYLLTTHYSLLTTYYSLLTTHYSLLLQAEDLEAAYPMISPEITIAKRLLAALGRPVGALIRTLTLTLTLTRTPTLTPTLTLTLTLTLILIRSRPSPPPNACAASRRAWRSTTVSGCRRPSRRRIGSASRPGCSARSISPRRRSTGCEVTLTLTLTLPLTLTLTLTLTLSVTLTRRPGSRAAVESGPDTRPIQARGRGQVGPRSHRDGGTREVPRGGGGLPSRLQGGGAPDA